MTKYQQLNVLNNKNVLSHTSGHHKSKIKASAGLVPLEGCDGGACSVPLS